ncbi:MAG: valine--tRNA ligase [Ardenticatenales bacterium]|nr:valine--tRNA ligase [Ardenticatenales bacterium]
MTLPPNSPIHRGPMAKAYDPHAFEAAVYDWWEQSGYFRPEAQEALGQTEPDAKPFVISMPPPNVTGQLHTGHALTASMEDLMVRHHRLRGRPTLWVPGTDHAGIATQSVVERVLSQNGETRQSLGREAFVEMVWDYKAEFGDIINRQHRRLGVSCDWTRERFTLDEGLSRAVAECFVRLYDDGLIYRGLYLVNWDCQLQSVVSDIEVEYHETTGTLYTFTYPLEGGGSIPVATSRPETILGDTAVAVHPDDPRYAAVIGRTALVPMLDRPIPVIADPYVDIAFGTGALKVTPGHDPNDYVLGQKHALEQINILNPDGTLNGNAGPYAGLDRLEARKRIWADMDAAGLVVGTKPLQHAVGHSQRSGTIVEPMLSTQWFVKMGPLAEAAIASVNRGDVQFVPERFTKEFHHWMENIRDWVISRQLWWGHRIPVWYGLDGTAFAGRDETEARARASAHYGTAGSDIVLTQDSDVLDTWFSSGLWPFSTLGWPDETDDLKKWYPTTVLETGYDILFFWVARMVMMGLAMTGKAPFEVVYLHGLVRDASGRKMSKSLGNARDPLELIDQFGCDALRFTLATGSTPGVDMKLTDERLTDSRNFANKLWNVGRFIQGILGQDASGADFTPLPLGNLETRWSELSLADRWILSRASDVTVSVTRLFDAYQFGEAGRQLYEFTWHELADWYLEAAKVRLYGGDDGAAAATRQVIWHVFDRALTLLHPFMPYVTEVIWGHLPHPADSAPALMISRWPTHGARDEAAEADFGLVQAIVKGIRNVRAEHDVEPGHKVAATIQAGKHAAMLATQAAEIVGLARIDPAQLVIGAGWDVDGTAAEPAEAHATVVAAEGVTVWLPMAGLVDADKERERLTAELAQAEADVARLTAMLANASFVERAPEAVVRRERERLAEAEGRVGALTGRV